jgi:hypothetical protein
MAKPWARGFGLAIAPLLLGLAAALGATSRPQQAQTIDGNALLKEVDRRLNPPAYEAYRRLVNVEPNGRTREYLLYTVSGGRDRVAALFLEPASDKGRSTLRLGDNMWLFVPAAGKPVRITSLQSVVGGVFNNADILSLDYAAEYDVSAVAPNGPDVLLTLKAKSRAVAYDQLRMWVTTATKVPTKIECLTPTAMLIKTLYFKDVKSFAGGVVRPSLIETDSPLYRGYQSSMTWLRITPRTFGDEVFTLTFMPKLDSLRR